MILCRGRNAQRQASIFLLPQPVTASIPALDVLSMGSESESVLRFNLPCLLQPLSPNPPIRPCIFCRPFSPSSSEISCIPSLSLAFCLLSFFFFISAHLLPLSPTLVGSSPGRATVIRTGRELDERQTNAELGHHCLRARGPLSR